MGLLPMYQNLIIKRKQESKSYDLTMKKHILTLEITLLKLCDASKTKKKKERTLKVETEILN